jgi:paraquat-inducible protein A
VNDSEKSAFYLLCRVCEHSISLPTTLEEKILCDRCGYENPRKARKSSRLTLVFSLTALIFYFPANIFPFMTVDIYGNRTSTTIWGGVVSLADSGSLAIAVIIFLASIVIPFLKLVVLFYLALSPKNERRSKLNTRLYYIVEAIGRWSMLDIFLLAILVAIMKLGPWTTAKPEIGSLLFAFVVIFTLLASANFDPLLLWEPDQKADAIVEKKIEAKNKAKNKVKDLEKKNV